MIALVTSGQIAAGPMLWGAILESLVIAGYDVRDGILYGPDRTAFGPLPGVEPTEPLVLGACTVLPVVEAEESTPAGKTLVGHEAVIAGECVELRPVWGDLPPGPTLAEVRTSSCAGIDAKAEALRLTVLTPGTGQMAAYQRKESQARAYLDDLAAGTVPADAALAAAEYPAIYGEVGITAETPEGVARVVVANADAWYAFGDAIERARLAGKRAVMAATDAAGVDVAVAAIVWPAAAANGGS